MHWWSVCGFACRARSGCSHYPPVCHCTCARHGCFVTVEYDDPTLIHTLLACYTCCRQQGAFAVGSAHCACVCVRVRHTHTTLRLVDYYHAAALVLADSTSAEILAETSSDPTSPSIQAAAGLLSHSHHYVTLPHVPFNQPRSHAVQCPSSTHPPLRPADPCQEPRFHTHNTKAPPPAHRRCPTPALPQDTREAPPPPRPSAPPTHTPTHLPP